MLCFWHSITPCHYELQINCSQGHISSPHALERLLAQDFLPHHFSISNENQELWWYSRSTAHWNYAFIYIIAITVTLWQPDNVPSLSYHHKPPTINFYEKKKKNLNKQTQLSTRKQQHTHKSGLSKHPPHKPTLTHTPTHIKKKKKLKAHKHTRTHPHTTQHRPSLEITLCDIILLSAVPGAQMSGCNVWSKCHS